MVDYRQLVFILTRLISLSKSAIIFYKEPFEQNNLQIIEQLKYNLQGVCFTNIDLDTHDFKESIKLAKSIGKHITNLTIFSNV